MVCMVNKVRLMVAPPVRRQKLLCTPDRSDANILHSQSLPQLLLLLPPPPLLQLPPRPVPRMSPKLPPLPGRLHQLLPLHRLTAALQQPRRLLLHPPAQGPLRRARLTRWPWALPEPRLLQTWRPWALSVPRSTPPCALPFSTPTALLSIF